LVAALALALAALALSCTYIDSEPPLVADAGCCCADAAPLPEPLPEPLPPCSPVEVAADCSDGWARAELPGTVGELGSVVALGELAAEPQLGYAWTVLPGLLIRDGHVAVACGTAAQPVVTVLFRLPCSGTVEGGTTDRHVAGPVSVRTGEAGMDAGSRSGDAGGGMVGR